MRDALVNSLITADNGAGIVRVGYPRRRFTSTNNTLRASAGKLLLALPLPAAGGNSPTIFLSPPSRLPDLPFWVSVEGELIYVYDEVTMPNLDTMKAFACERVPRPISRVAAPTRLGRPPASQGRRRGHRGRFLQHLRARQADGRR